MTKQSPQTYDDLRAAAQAATPIPEYPGYAVSREGTVFSTGSNWRGYGIRELTQTANADGYPKVRLTVVDRYGTRRVNMAVHRLVAACFLWPRPTPEHEIRHLNGDKTDNRVENLAWGTKADNAADREQHGRTAKGTRNGAATLDADKVRAIRRLYRSGESQYLIAAAFRVHQTTVSKIVRGKWWAHVAD